MKKKLIIILAIIILGILITILLLSDKKSGDEKNKENKKSVEESATFEKQEGIMFEQSNYPTSIVEEDGNIKLTINSDNIPDGKWNIKSSIDCVEIKNDNNTFEFSPTQTGTTLITIIRQVEYEDYTFDALKIKFMVYVNEKSKKLKATCLEDVVIRDYGGEIGGEDTDSPFIILNNPENTDNISRVTFFNGFDNWEINYDNKDDHNVSFYSMGNDNRGLQYVDFMLTSDYDNIDIKNAKKSYKELMKESKDKKKKKEKDKDNESEKSDSDKTSEETIIFKNTKKKTEVLVKATVSQDGRISLSLA